MMEGEQTQVRRINLGVAASISKFAYKDLFWLLYDMAMSDIVY